MAANADLTPLMIACQENDTKKVEEILKKDQQASSALDKSGKVAMHHCAEGGDLEMFKKVFHSDPSLMDKRDEDGYTPLTFAVIGGNGPVVDFLLEKGADINNVDAERHSHIHWATVCGHAEILTKLLKNGSLPSTPDLHGAHALHYATQTGTLEPQASTSTITTEGMEILKILLKYGANVNCTDFEERTPLLWAASSGNSAAVLSLLEAGADKHSCDKDRLTVLHCAASRGHGDVIRTICRTASDVQINARDRNGSSPLFYAAALGHVDAVKALLEVNAMTELQDKKLRTAAHCAAAKGQVGTLKVLHQHGASFALENYRGDLPIHEACQAGSLELIEWMLSLAPDYANATNHDGRTPLHLAAALGHLDTCRLLVGREANKDALMLSKSACVTALDLAEEKEHEDVVEYLRSVGAQKCDELTPLSVVEEFKKHMATRRLATAKGARKTKSTSEVQAQTDETPKVDQAVATGNGSLEHLVPAGAGDHKESEAEAEANADANADANIDDTVDAGGQHDTSAEGGETGGKDEKSMEASQIRLDEQIALKEGAQAETGQVISKAAGEDAVEGEPKIEPTEAKSKGKKHGKRKSKTKESSKSITEKAKCVENGVFDSSRTSADVSEIPIASANGEDEMKRKAKHASMKVTIANGTDDREQRTQKEEEEEYSTDEDHRDRVEEGTEISSETSGNKTGAKFRAHGSGLNLSSLRGSDSDRQSSREFLSTRSHGAIDRFRVDWESSLRSSVHRYSEEKRIFQELANLKRLQIQYGNVQEEVIVRRLIDDFLRGYNVKHGDFQVNTFNAWEKFLYDQLKILYRKEKDSLMRSYESKLKNQASLFEQKQAAAIGRRRGADHIDRLSPRLYKASFMSNNLR